MKRKLKRKKKIKWFMPFGRFFMKPREVDTASINNGENINMY